MDIHGAYVVADRAQICSGCMSDGEVDAQIRLMKLRLGRVAVQMKRAIKENKDKPIL